MSNNDLIVSIENTLLSPGSDFYIATILYDPAGGSLDPRTIDTIDLGSINVGGASIGFVLNQFQVKGLSNVQILPAGISVAGNNVTFHAELPNKQVGYARPPGVPNQIQAGGPLVVTLAGQPLAGTIAVTATALTDLTGTFSATEGAGAQSAIAINFATLAMTADPADVTIVATLDTVFLGTINAILGSAEVKQQLISQINAQLGAPTILSALSSAATQQANAAFGGS